MTVAMPLSHVEGEAMAVNFTFDHAVSSFDRNDDTRSKIVYTRVKATNNKLKLGNNRHFTRRSAIRTKQNN